MRRYFELAATWKTGREFALEDVRLRAPIIPKKFFHTAGNFREHHEESTSVNWSHPVLPWIVFFQNVDAIIGPTTRSSTPRRYQRARLRARAGGGDRQGRQVLLARGGRGLHRRLPDLQRHHRTRHPARGDEVGVFCLRRASTRSARSAHGSSRRTRSRPACAVDGVAGKRRAPAELPHEPDVGHGPEIISHYSAMGYSAGDIISTGTVAGVAGFSEDAASLYLRPGDVVEAEIEGVGVLRNPYLVGRGPSGPGPARRRRGRAVARWRSSRSPAAGPAAGAPARRRVRGDPVRDGAALRGARPVAGLDRSCATPPRRASGAAARRPAAVFTHGELPGTDEHA